MKLVCSWCLAEGNTGELGEKEPLDDLRVSHGICPPHRAGLQAQMAQIKAQRGTLTRVSLVLDIDP